MLRLSNHRSKSCYAGHSRNYQSASSNRSQDDTSFHTLKMRVREAACQTGTDKFAELRQSAVYGECYEWGRRQAQVAARKASGLVTDTAARDAAAVQTICYTLDAFVDFSRHYDSPAVADSRTGKQEQGKLEQLFLRQIRSTHRHNLLMQFHASLRANSDERRAAVLSALDRSLLDKLAAEGVISLSGSDRKDARRSPTHLAVTLNEAELLALIDYLNSATGTFNVVNGAAIASAYYGEHALQARVGVFSATLASAIDKLCEHPFFARRDIVCYKGIRLGALDAPFRLAVLDEACTNGGVIAFPNVLSASGDPEHSYARKKFEEGYTLECRLTMKRAFYADPFHDTSTMGEQEILGPAKQRFRVSGKSGFKVFDWSGETPQEVDVARYELTPLAQ